MKIEYGDFTEETLLENIGFEQSSVNQCLNGLKAIIAT